MYPFTNSPRARINSVAALGAMLTCVSTASAQGVGQPPNYTWEWATITHAGNAPISEAQTPGWVFDNTYFRQWSGTVNYEYRIAKTEVTCSQYAEFLNAYAQAFNFSSPSSSVTGEFLRWQSNGPGQPAHYGVPQGFANVAINPAGLMAMMMANWLHNQKDNAPLSFRTGAYDVNAAIGGDGLLTRIPTRTPGARFWIPSTDEWAKAVYFDPNRYGPGQEGYWQYPNSSDSPLTQGLARNGGQTLAGVTPGSIIEYQDVGSYVNITTPWGLFDASGGWGEWTDTQYEPMILASLGSRHYGPASDRIDNFISAGSIVVATRGFRLASAVPAAPTAGVGVLLVLHIARRSTRT